MTAYNTYEPSVVRLELSWTQYLGDLVALQADNPKGLPVGEGAGGSGIPKTEEMDDRFARGAQPHGRVVRTSPRGRNARTVVRDRPGAKRIERSAPATSPRSPCAHLPTGTGT